MNEKGTGAVEQVGMVGRFRRVGSSVGGQYLFKLGLYMLTHNNIATHETVGEMTQVYSSYDVHPKC